jgi:hypothetical protein
MRGPVASFAPDERHRLTDSERKREKVWWGALNPLKYAGYAHAAADAHGHDSDREWT